MVETLNRKPEWPVGEILIDPTIEQAQDALAKGLNPDAGKALLSLAVQGKLSSSAAELIDRAWGQLEAETGFPVRECLEYDSTKLPSQIGVVSTVTFRDKI